MARYHSDSDDDRRSRHRHSRSSRKRDRRSRSRSRDRDRRRRSRSREDERRRRRSRSRSRSSERSYKSSTRSSSSRKGSRSGSRNTSDSETRKDGRDKREKSSSSGASQVSKEKTKEKMKSALKAVESKDEELKLEKEKKERAKLVPDAETILEIESNSFSAQSFSSSAGSKNKVVEKSEVAISDQSHENAMFGGSSAAVLNSLPLNAQTSNKSLTTTTEIVDKENLLASCLHEDEDSKNARWVEKLKKLRQRFLSPT